MNFFVCFPFFLFGFAYCFFGLQTSVGIKRLNKFMNCDELNNNSVEHDPKERKYTFDNKYNKTTLKGEAAI